MLGKLIKYDLKSLGRLILPLFAVLIGSSVALRIVIEVFGGQTNIDGSIASVISSIFSVVIGLVYALSLTASIFGVYVIIAMNYHKSLMSDRGYFYLTLPVTHDMHLVSKLLSGAAFIIISAVVFVLSFIPLFLGNVDLPDILEGLSDIWEVIQEYVLAKNGVLILILWAIVILFGTQIMIFFCITIGQLMSNHRILGAFLAFIGHLILSRTISSVMSVNSLSAFNSKIYDVASVGEAFSAFLLRLIIYYIIIYAIEYVATRFVLKNKLNIE